MKRTAAAAWRRSSDTVPHRHSGRYVGGRALAVLLATAAMAATAVTPSLASTTRHASASPGTGAVPAVYPVPRQEQADGTSTVIPGDVEVVVGTSTDASALKVVDTVLTDAGARHITQVGDQATPPPAALTVYVGGAGENALTAGVLRSLGQKDATGLPDGGYVLDVGRPAGHGPVAVLDGVDPTGTYYAAQTLRQLVRRVGQVGVVPGVSIRDWPSMPVRGVIEGFYGPPWSTADRLAQLDFYGEHKMNTYVYSPKDDPYLREDWREPYPPAQLAVIKQLVDRATADHVNFTYALSPGLSVCYSSASDEQALVNKFQSLWDIGVRSFAIPLDDISYTTWNCAADETKFGTGGAAAAAAQSYLLNEVDKDFIATHQGAQPLEMVPTEYASTQATPYKTTLAQDLGSDVIVEWTGVGVIPATITGDQAQAAKQVYGHQVLLWDNYPVNDYVTSQLLLGPYVGRSPDLANDLVGITANPMLEAEPSMIALFNVADFTWNSQAYNSQRSWDASLAELAGGNPVATAALHTFADVNYEATDLNLPEAPVLSAKIAAFWKAWNAGDSGAATALRLALTELQAAPGVLEATLKDSAFLSEAKPWLESTAAWGTATLTALDMLVAQRDGDQSRAAADRQKLPALVSTAESYPAPDRTGTTPASVGHGVLDVFVQDALATQS